MRPSSPAENWALRALTYNPIWLSFISDKLRAKGTNVKLLLDLKIQSDALFSEISEISSPAAFPPPPIAITPSPELVSPMERPWSLI